MIARLRPLDHVRCVEGEFLATDKQSIAVEIRNVGKRFGDFVALSSASLSIPDNEFFTLLGPSGCGKTTLLRLIAGFEDVSEGQILLYGQELEGLPPHKRPVNTVFQHYALFPHMTVSENVAFGLRMKGFDKSRINETVQRMLGLVHLEKLADRRPHQLSGGQQQRAALARAIAPGPKVLLLDEPLSALDLKLRQAMRLELKQLQKDTGITFVFVTHDQEEALAMSDRIAVMSDGTIQQTGDAREIYDNPLNRFVANFIGEANFIDAELAGQADGLCQYRLPNGHIVSCGGAAPAPSGSKRVILLRPEKIGLTADPQAGGLEGVVSQAVYLGTDTQYRVKIDGGMSLLVRRQNFGSDMSRFRTGDRVGLRIEDGAARVLAD